MPTINLDNDDVRHIEEAMSYYWEHFAPHDKTVEAFYRSIYRKPTKWGAGPRDFSTTQKALVIDALKTKIGSFNPAERQETIARFTQTLDKLRASP